MLFSIAVRSILASQFGLARFGMVELSDNLWGRFNSRGVEYKAGEEEEEGVKAWTIIANLGPDTPLGIARNLGPFRELSKAHEKNKYITHSLVDISLKRVSFSCRIRL